MKIILIYLFLLNFGILIDLPEAYDVRDHYKCDSFYDIRDQRGCGGCWAFATSEVISDRYCINSKGKNQLLFSEMELLTCCKNTSDSPIAGCDGGDEQLAFHYWIKTGLPTKSCKEFLFGENETVEPYSNKLKCLTKCSNTNINIERYKGSFQSFISGGEEEIKREIYFNGPVTAAFNATVDFQNYWIYTLPKDPNATFEGKCSTGKVNHSVKIIGWGKNETTNQKYWLCVNSWGKSGANKGIFRIIRGKNNCGIESNINAGYINERILDSKEKPLFVFRDQFYTFKNLTNDFR